MSPEFLITALIVVLAPGTGVIYTLGTGLTRGPSAAIAAALGCTLGILPSMLAAMLGLAAVLHASALAFQLVKFAGVAFLLYLAWTTLMDKSTLTVKPAETARSYASIAAKGALINILNPKLSIFFLAFLPQFLSGEPAAATQEMALLGGIFMLMTFVVFIGYGIFAAAARTRILSSARAMAWIRRIFAATFAGLGLRLAFERA